MRTVALDARDAHLPQLRGWGRYTRSLLEGLRAAGAPVREVVGRWPGPEAAWEQAGLPLSALTHRDAAIHAPNCFLPLARPCPGIVTVHDLAFEVFPDDFAPVTRVKFRRLARAAARSADRVICVSRFTASDVVARWGVDAARIRVVPNAPSLALGDAPAPDGAPYVLGIGDLRAKKGWDTLVTAWRDGGFAERLVIAGADSGEASRLRALAPGVELPGYVGDAELDALLRGARALVHPSHYEGFGLVIVEAMARGVPVACADATALPETAAGAAALFAPGDPKACAEALRGVLDDRDAWAAKGRDRAAQLSWRRTAHETWDVYREVL